MYVKVANGQPAVFPYPLDQIRKDNPGTSFPRDIPDSTLALYDVYPVIEAPISPHDPQTHRAVRDVYLADGVWQERWTIEQLPEDLAGANVRAKRASLLSQCDWTQLGDSPVQPVNEWRAYRQALRDITKLPGYPHNITWPEPPNSTTR